MKERYEPTIFLYKGGEVLAHTDEIRIKEIWISSYLS